MVCIKGESVGGDRKRRKKQIFVWRNGEKVVSLQREMHDK